MSDKKPFWAKCDACGHCWTVAFYPMVAATFAQVLLAARCPMCGHDKATVAKQDAGELLEPSTR